MMDLILMKEAELDISHLPVMIDPWRGSVSGAVSSACRAGMS